MPRFEYKSDRCGNGCSTVYRAKGENRTAPRGKAALGRVCFRDDAATRDERWEAKVAHNVGYGRTKDVAVSAALTDEPVGVSLWTLQEVESMTGIPARTMRDWIKAGYLKSWSDCRTKLVTCRAVWHAAAAVIGGKHSERARKCPCDSQEAT
jgi:hypothetical protein